MELVPVLCGANGKKRKQYEGGRDRGHR